jgi:NitT/TauT family transport system substrate-binding protein
MRKPQTRRQFLTNLTCFGAWTSGAATLFPRRLDAAEPALEMTAVRFAKIPVICFAPQYVCEELLRTEGFTDIRYVDADDPLKISTELGHGKYDFCANVTPGHLAAIDAGAPITIVSGVHAGCYELFAQNGIRGIADLKGKTVGCSATPDLIQTMAAYVGLDPKKDLRIVLDPSGKALEQFVDGKIDAYMGLPPEPQQLHARGFNHVVVRTALDPPWSQYFCCVLAGNRQFVAKYPGATKRVIRAFLKAADLCASDPERAARRLVDGGFVERYDDALQTLKDNPYGRWRDYDAEDTVRFYALRQHELGMIKKTPQKIIAESTDWRFLNELKRELKA